MTFAVDLISHKFIAAEILKYTKLLPELTRRREVIEQQID